MTMGHEIILDFEEDRFSHHFGEYFYVEKMGGRTMKIEYLGRDYESADIHARAAARIYGYDIIYEPCAPRDCFGSD